MTRQIAAAALALALGAAACGSKEDKHEEQAREQAAEATRQAAEASRQAAQAAQSADQAAQEAAKGFEHLAKAFGGAASADGKPVDPVSFRDMQALFPDLDGWEKGRPTGERITVPFPVSQAEVTYTRGNSRITIKAMDSGFNQLFLAPYAMFLQTGYERETEDGYERSIAVGGQPGWEKWNSDTKDGELNALVGRRFLLTIEGNDLDDVKVLHALANSIDMTRFAALK